MLKWNFTTPRAEFVEQLKEQMRPCFGKALHTNLFHADFKYHIIAISTMQQVLYRDRTVLLSQGRDNGFALRTVKVPRDSVTGCIKFNCLN